MNDDIIVSGSTDRTLRVWNANTGDCKNVFYGHSSTVRCMAMCGDYVVSGSRHLGSNFSVSIGLN